MSRKSNRDSNAWRFSALCCIPLTLALLTLLQMSTVTEALTHSVFTYRNSSSQMGSSQMATSSALVWETYNPKNIKQLHYAVEGGKYISEDEHYPIYVCRITIAGVPTSGHTEKVMQRHVCIAADYKHGPYDNFDVLLNKGHLGKVGWKPWNKFMAEGGVGAVHISENSYIARRRVMIDDATEHVGGADYNLGRLELLGMGKIKIMENEREVSYDNGEVLKETEPIRYELRHIKLDQIRLDMRENITELATGILANPTDIHSVVQMELSYDFDSVQYWGKYEGTARSLPTKIFEKDSTSPTEIYWSLKYSKKRTETKSVHTELYPGTAINVTLKGNYVTLEAPYKAKLHAFYEGSDESISRSINSEVQKSYLKDVKLEFSAVYWIENGTVLPTTTTTSTTSTTTHPTTTSTGEPKPMHEPPVVQLKDVGVTHSGPDHLEKTLIEPAASNEIPNEVPENYAEKHHDDGAKPAMAGIAAGSVGSGTASPQPNCYSYILHMLLACTVTAALKALNI